MAHNIIEVIVDTKCGEKLIAKFTKRKAADDYVRYCIQNKLPYECTEYRNNTTAQPAIDVLEYFNNRKPG